MEIEKSVRGSGQFEEEDMSNEGLMNNLLNVWNLSVCPSNAMLGGYLANFVMFYVQRKQKPLHNFLFFDMWSNMALEVLMRNQEDEKMHMEQKKKKAVVANGNGHSAQVDISELSVKQKKRSNEIVLLDSDDEEEDETMIDID